MTREIKFRAWDKANNCMTNYFTIGAGGGVAQEKQNPEGEFSLSPRPDLSVMQYAGLKDETGVEIYEGDILEVRDFTGLKTYEWVVKFSGGGWSVYAHSLHGLPFWASFNVIGNIHENPELVE